MGVELIVLYLSSTDKALTPKIAHIPQITTDSKILSIVKHIKYMKRGKTTISLGGIFIGENPTNVRQTQ